MYVCMYTVVFNSLENSGSKGKVNMRNTGHWKSYVSVKRPEYRTAIFSLVRLGTSDNVC